MAQMIQFPAIPAKSYRFEVNGREYEVYPVSNGWRWRSGQWWAIDFRTMGGFECYAHAAQDVMRDARLMNNGISTQETKMEHIVKHLEKTMRCNCDLDNWEPERSTGHSHVCRIHKAAIALETSPAQLRAAGIQPTV